MKQPAALAIVSGDNSAESGISVLKTQLRRTNKLAGKQSATASRKGVLSAAYLHTNPDFMSVVKAAAMHKKLCESRHVPPSQVFSDLAKLW